MAKSNHCPVEVPTETTCWDGWEHRIIIRSGGVQVGLGQCERCGTTGIIRDGVFVVDEHFFVPTAFAIKEIWPNHEEDSSE